MPLKECPSVNKEEINVEHAFRILYQGFWKDGVLSATNDASDPRFDLRNSVMNIGHQIDSVDYSRKYPDNFNQFLGIFGYTSQDSRGKTSIFSKRMDFDEFQALVMEKMTPSMLYNIKVTTGERFSERKSLMPQIIFADCPPELTPAR